MSEANTPPPEEQQTGHPSEEAQMLSDLERLYQPLVARNARSLERVWARLEQHQQQHKSGARAPRLPLAFPGLQTKEQSMQPFMERFSHGGAWRRALGTLVAVVVLALLVGSMVAVFTLARGKTATGPSITGAGPTASSTIKPTPGPTHGLGTTVYTSPVSGDDFYAFAWSPDSKRVAASTQSQVQIWDATTGKNQLIYTPRGSGGSVLALAWSPDGKKLAVGAVTSDGLEIVNPATGTVIHTFNPTSALQTSGKGPAVSTLPLSGGSGVSAAAWSPDGKYIAAAFFGPAYGNKVVVWNAQTGALVTSFTKHTDRISSLAWSADGAYLASTSYDQTVQVWDAHTGKVIFKHDAAQVGGVAWSPTGTRLVFASDASTFLVWDVAANTQITSYQAPVNGAVAWSPDGKAIAVASNTDVMLWDAATGAHIFTYTETGNQVRSLAWSPDGKYIVSGGAAELGNNFAKVWIAAPLP